MLFTNCCISNIRIMVLPSLHFFLLCSSFLSALPCNVTICGSAASWLCGRLSNCIDCRSVQHAIFSLKTLCKMLDFLSTLCSYLRGFLNLRIHLREVPLYIDGVHTAHKQFFSKALWIVCAYHHQHWLSSAGRRQLTRECLEQGNGPMRFTFDVSW